MLLTFRKRYAQKTSGSGPKNASKNFDEVPKKNCITNLISYKTRSYSKVKNLPVQNCTFSDLEFIETVRNSFSRNYHFNNNNIKTKFPTKNSYIYYYNFGYHTNILF